MSTAAPEMGRRPICTRRRFGWSRAGKHRLPAASLCPQPTTSPRREKSRVAEASTEYLSSSCPHRRQRRQQRRPPQQHNEHSDERPRWDAQWGTAGCEASTYNNEGEAAARDTSTFVVVASRLVVHVFAFIARPISSPGWVDPRNVRGA